MWVVGLEADLAWAYDKKSSTGIPGLTTIFAPTDSVQMKDTWDGGLRARLSYLITPAHCSTPLAAHHG
jgi:outer membrane immunogenic protein